MEENDKESKTEEPTEKRINDSVEEGNVPVSREIAVAASLLVFTTVYLLSGETIANNISQMMANIVDGSISSQPLSNRDLVAVLTRIGMSTAVILGPLFILILVTAFVSSAAQNEPKAVAKRITPQFSRVSPFDGWKRLFSMKSFVEFLKSLAKIGAAVAIVSAAMMPVFKDMVATMYRMPEATLLTIMSMTAHLLIWVTGVSIVIAVADFVWQRYSWWTQLRMSRQDIKDEFKQAEGDPIIKSRLMSLGRDRARSRMMQAVTESTLIIANPTHFAVALRYERDRDAAPVVVAKGMDLVALRIREIAEINEIPVFERVELARALYKVVKVNQIIPEQFYKALAELIRTVYDKRMA